jgi:hypothetical protein
LKIYAKYIDKRHIIAVKIEDVDEAKKQKKKRTSKTAHISLFVVEQAIMSLTAIRKSPPVSGQA